LAIFILQTILTVKLLYQKHRKMPRLIRLDKDTLSEIEKVKKYAAENIFDEHSLLAIKEKLSPPPGDNPDFVVHIHQNFRVVYTIDEINENKYHHLSISYKSGCPGIPEAIIILKAFGINREITDLDNVWLEEGNIVNLVTIIE
jgi:hypothetical protein